MKRSWFSYFLPPQFSSYEQTQQARLLHFMLAAVFFGASFTTVTNLTHQWYVEAGLLFLLAIAALVGFFLNRTKYFSWAAFILCASLFVVLSLLLYNGVGLYDTVILGFPLLIICAAFLFGRQGLVISTLSSVFSALGIYFLEISGLFSSPFEVTLLRALVTAVLFVLTGAIIWVVRDAWEINLLNLQKSYVLTLDGWARALEYRDGETAGHTQRVTRLARLFGETLGMSSEELWGLEYGAYLHDIGKMAIPDHILLKEGPLSEEEWEIMRKHPVRSRDFIAQIPYLQPAIDIAYYHHERWDGSGYPEGLRGEAIPLRARIFTIIDNWDALTSDRPYRKAWSREKVIGYLNEESGSIFDPNIVGVFLNIIQQEDI